MSQPTRSLSSACTTWHDAWQVEAGLGKALEKAYEAVGPPEVTGLLSVRAYVESDGSVSKIDTLVDTLVADPGLVDGDVSLDEARSATTGDLDTATTQKGNQDQRRQTQQRFHEEVNV